MDCGASDASGMVSRVKSGLWGDRADRAMGGHRSAAVYGERTRAEGAWQKGAKLRRVIRMRTSLAQELRVSAA